MAKARKAEPAAPQWPAASVEMWPLDKIVEYPNNPRTHSDEQIDLLAKAMMEEGVTAPILIDEAGVIIYGHGRRLGALKNSFKEYPVVIARGWTEERKRAVRIRDNSIASLSGWNKELIQSEIGWLKTAGYDIPLLGFPEAQLRGWGVTLGSEVADPDAVPALPKKPIVREGDLWTLGDHRILCGDSTNTNDVAKALGKSKPHLMVTDPPYGVMLDPSWRDRAGANTLAKSGKGGETYMDSGKTDTEARWDAVWKLAPVDVFYVWCAGARLVDVHNALTETGFDVRQILIWNKMVLTLTRSHYWWGHEHCLYGVRKGSTASWVGKAGQSTVWDIPSPKHIMSGSKEENEPHPAQKPIECMKRPIENNSKKGDFVYEPFSGSGTTIMACEMTSRKAIAIEIAPPYAQLAIERWQKATGLKATLNGKTLEQVAKSRKAG